MPSNHDPSIMGIPYESGIVSFGIRDGHQIVAASPKHFPVLFGRRGIERPEGTAQRNIDGFLPSSPATIRNFVGRVSTLEKLFDWLENSDDPIQYLSGKGGSGKTTIAYEFAKIVKDHGGNILVAQRDLYQPVLIRTHAPKL
jgi:hypothetical protein